MATDSPERGGGRGDSALVHDRARVVRRYLSSLDMRRPGRTAARTSETINHRIHQVDTLLVSADPVQRLHLTQERIDLHAELLRLSNGVDSDTSQIEAAFIRVVRGYSDRHGVTFSAWRQIGVDVAVLEKGGVGPAKAPRAGRPAAAPVKPASAAAPPAPAAAPPAPAAAPAPPPAAPVAAPVDPGCLDELPPLPRAEGPKPAAKAAVKAVAKKAKPAAATTKSPSKKTAAAKKAAAPVQQELPASESL